MLFTERVENSNSSIRTAPSPLPASPARFQIYLSPDSTRLIYLFPLSLRVSEGFVSSLCGSEMSPDSSSSSKFVSSLESLPLCWKEISFCIFPSSLIESVIEYNGLEVVRIKHYMFGIYFNNTPSGLGKLIYYRAVEPAEKVFCSALCHFCSFEHFIAPGRNFNSYASI